MITVLLGSIGTFPSYVKDDPVGLSENNILQNPEIQKIIGLFPEFVPILEEAQATSNGNAIQSEKGHVMELIGEVTSAQLEMNGIKGKLAVLEHNPSKNSKRVQVLQQELLDQTVSFTDLSTELLSASKNLISLQSVETTTLEVQVSDLQNELGDLNIQMDADELNLDSFSAKVELHISEVKKLGQEFSTSTNNMAILMDQLSNSMETGDNSTDNSIMNGLTSSLENTTTDIERLKELKIIQSELESQSHSYLSQIRTTDTQTDIISRQILQISNSIINHYFTISITQNVILVETIALISQGTTPVGSPGIPFKIQDLQNQIDTINDVLVDLQAQIDDLQTQINALTVRIVALEAAIVDLQGQIDALKTRATNLENRATALENQLNEGSSVIDNIAISFTILAGLFTIAGIACLVPIVGCQTASPAFLTVAGVLGSLVGLLVALGDKFSS